MSGSDLCNFELNQAPISFIMGTKHKAAVMAKSFLHHCNVVSIEMPNVCLRVGRPSRDGECSCAEKKINQHC